VVFSLVERGGWCTLAGSYVPRWWTANFSLDFEIYFGVNAGDAYRYRPKQVADNPTLQEVHVSGLVGVSGVSPY
jgi:hypothetical protein